MSAIKKTNLVVHFDFDVNGDLIKQYSSIKRHNKTDTTFTMYTYSQMGNLITKRTNDAHGFYSYNYEYDASDRLSLEKPIVGTKMPIRTGMILNWENSIPSSMKAIRILSKNNKLLKNIFNNNGRIYEKT